MSLLDDVSIVVTPNGYKAGTLYGVLPTYTEGSEEITNGDFAIDSDWTFGGTSFSAGAILFDSSGDYAFQIWSDTVNTIYKLTITKTGSGTLRFRSGFAGSASTKIDIPESGIVYFTSTSDTDRIQIYGDSGSVNTTLNSVSVKEVTSADMDVTRATAGTRVDEDGLVNYAEVVGDSALTGNNSNFDTGIGGWVTYNGGTLTHSTDKLEVTLTTGESGARIDTNSLISGGQIGKTFKVRARIWQGTTSNTLFKIFIGGVQENITISSTPTYFEVELTPSSTSMLTIYRAGGSGGIGTYFIDDVTVKEVTRDNVPRIDYTGGGCPHILSEPQRTNLVTYSEDFTDSSWNLDGSNVNLTRTPNATTSPSGENNATKLIGNNISKDPSTSYIGVSTSAATPYTTSVFAKKGEYDYLVSGIGSYASGYYAIFNLSNGTVSTSPTASGTTASIEDYGNGWYRCLVNTTNTGGGEFLFISPSVDGTLTTNYTNTTNGIYVWGGQVEEGSYVTSYIPTSGSTVTRNQDIFTRDGIGSLINSTEGVLFAEIAALSDNDGTYRSLSISDSSRNNEIEIDYTNDEKIRVLVKSGGGTIFSTSFIIDTTIFNKVAVKYKLNDFAVFINGTEEYTITSGAIPIGLNRLAFDRGDGGTPFYAKVKQLQVYNTALTDEQLLQLTGTSGTDFYESYAEMASALTYTIQ